MPLDPIDFEARPEIPYSGWPISRTDLDPYYLRAQSYVETPAADAYDTSDRKARLGLPAVPFDPARLETYLYAESPPTAFGYVYEDRLRAAADLRVLIHAAVLEVEADATAAQVTRMRCATLGGPTFGVTARHYVLAAGGIEIPRLLLLSNAVAPAGLGNENDLVGRFFMDHQSFRPALTALTQDRAAEFDLYTGAHEIDGGTFRGAIRASEALLREEGLANFLFFLFEERDRSPGRQSAETFRRRLGSGQSVPNFAYHLENVLTDLDGVTNEVYRTLSGSNTDLIPRVWLHPWIVTESIPDPESRVRLAETRDPVFGQPQAAMDWRMAEGQLALNIRATEVLAEELGRLSYGRVWSELLSEGAGWSSFIAHGKHHCGTTRMSADPKTGVVDPDCRMHGLSNLFVASSSVFPTQGAGTPTLTIVALAIRLAEHLKSRLARRDL